MKNLILFSLICIITSLFTSCRTNTSITERRYNKGYYITHSRENNDLIASDETHSVARSNSDNEQQIIRGTEKKAPENIYGKGITDGISEVEKDNLQHKEHKKFSLNKATKNTPKIFELPDIKPKLALSNPNKQHIQDPDGLSLFWIVILVILILWLLGFIGGVGSLIHLLLVVALILLILWLLRII